VKTLLQNVRAIDGLTPRFEAQPTTPEELAEALRSANDDRLAVAACGGGTQLDLGNVPNRLDVLLATTGLNRVVEYEPADLTVTVEAGMSFSDLQALLAEQGQFLALDPAAEPEATIGGLIATNASGPLRFAYGTARDLVIGTRVANPDGTLTRAGGRVVKNVAGYDLNKLYVGSLGTLAVIVELSFKLAPIPPALATIVGQFQSSASTRNAIGAVLRSPLSPLAIELHAPHTLVFRVGGYPQAVERQVRDLGQLIAEHDGQTGDASEHEWERLVTLRREAQQRELVLKAAAPIAESARLVELLEQHLAVLEPTVWASAGNGVAYAACAAPASADVVLELRRRVRELGGNASLVVQRCPLSLKQEIDVWGDPGPSLALMRALKEKLDPRATLNPGRYVGRL
jgi:glycolate oxidase FAD binding subunit